MQDQDSVEDPQDDVEAHVLNHVMQSQPTHATLAF